MPEKKSVPYEKITAMLEQDLSISQVSNRCNVPRSIVGRIANGENVRWFNPRKGSRDGIVRPMCTCCKLKPREKGNRFLCYDCMTNPNFNSHDEHGNWHRSHLGTS